MSSNTDNTTAPPKRKPWVSCAECRRLRVRCDRKFPCGPCRRRGCGSICPDGTTTHGSADGPWIDPTIELKDNLQKLAERIKALEGALETFSATHPLLTKEQKSLKTKYLKRGAHNRKTSTDVVDKSDETPEETNRASSLIVREDGVTECIAEEQGWWRYVHESETSLAHDQPSSLMLVTASFSLSLLMPCVHMFLSQQQYIKVICEYLPPAEETLTISKYFFDSAGWMFNAIAQDEFMSQIFSLFYSPGPLPDVMDDNFAHRLSCLYSIIAIGYLFDPASCRKVDSENAFRFACGAFLCGRGVEMPTIEALQALNLMNVHMWLVDPVQEKATNAAWILNGIIVKLCQAAGIHYDSKKFGLGQAEITKRRRLVSDVYMNDYLMASLTLRPPTIIAEHFDPAHVNEQDNSGGMTFSNWKIAFNAECVAPIFTETLGTTQPAYTTITRLNQKLKDHVLPELLQIRDGQNELDPGLWLQRYTAQLYRCRIVLTLHQSWFARALNDRSKDPLTGPYKESVDSVFRTAMTIIQVVEQMRTRLPHPTDRYWFIWKTLFAASVVIGSLVARSPELPLAKEGIERLDKAHELFLNVHSQFGDKALDALNNMRIEARRSTQVADRTIPGDISSVPTPTAHSSPPGLVNSSSSSSVASSSPSVQNSDILAYFPELGASFSAATMPTKMNPAPDSMHAVVPTLAVPQAPFTSLGTRAAQLSKAQFVASGTLPMSQMPQHHSPPVQTPGPSVLPHSLARQPQLSAPMQLQPFLPMQPQPAVTMQPQAFPSVPPEYMSPNNINFMQTPVDWNIPPADMSANAPMQDPIFNFPGMVQANSAWLSDNSSSSNTMMGFNQNLGMPMASQPMPDIDMNVEIDWSQVFMDAGLQM